MRRGWLAVCLLLPMMSGCLSFLDDDGDTRTVAPPGDVDDASQIRITGVAEHGSLAQPLTITAHDGIALSAIAYEPLTQDALPDGSAPTFPVVVFVHGFGTAKEMWICTPFGEPALPSPEDECPFNNMLQDYAEAGFIAIAYDTRGFGRSGGVVTALGPDELADLDTVIDFANEAYASNGKVGVTGISYGGAHAMMGLATNPKVTTAVTHQGWYDLYEGLAPGNTPKLEWSALLAAEGTATGRMHPMIYDWLGNALQRVNMQETEAAMDQRSPARFLADVDKPLLVCQGMQETLFPQSDMVWENHAGFTRAIIHQGGHGTLDEYCWEKTEAWFSFFLRGIDTEVDAWPALESTDASGGSLIAYDEFPKTATRQFFLRDPQLTDYSGSNSTFTVQQQVLSNPLQEPSGVWDLTGRPNEAIPYPLRQDPTATFFESSPMDESRVVLGSPQLTLQVAAGSQNQEFQVAVQLIHVDAEGDSRIISRGAYTHIPAETKEINGTAVVNLHFTKADLGPGDMLVLKVGGNDLSWFSPFPRSYTVNFTGHSELLVPFFSD